MALRPANPTDLPAVLELHTHSLPKHVHANFIHPFRHLYPESFEKATSSSPRKKLLTTSPHEYNIILADDDDEVLGWSFWRRNIGAINSSKVEKYQDLSLKLALADPRTEIPSLLAEAGLIEGKNKDQSDSSNDIPSLSIPRQNLCAFHTVFDTLQYFQGDHYYLSHLLVHPDQQRKGYGTILTLWGMYYASLEKVPVYLTASAEGERLYTKLGFKVIGEKGFPSIDDMSPEEQRNEEEILGKEAMKEQFNVPRPKIMVWQGTPDDEVFANKETMEKIRAVPCKIPTE